VRHDLQRQLAPPAEPAHAEMPVERERPANPSRSIRAKLVQSTMLNV
jgi:hypothetical protein